MCDILCLLIFLHSELMRSPGYFLSQWAWWMLSSFGSHFEISVLLFGWKWIGVAQIIDGILQNSFLDLSILLWALITMLKKSVLQSLCGMWQCCSTRGFWYLSYYFLNSTPLLQHYNIISNDLLNVFKCKDLTIIFFGFFSFWLPNFKIK